MRILLLAGILVLAVAAPAAAAERGVITGRVVNETTGEPASGVEVTLSGADENGDGRIRRTATTTEAGTYRFGSLPSAANWLYIVDARFEGGLFPGSAFQFPKGQEPKLETTMKVWNTTSDPNAIIVARDAMFVLPSDENSVGVVESVTVLNQTDLAYIGRGMASGSAETTLGLGLPNGAVDVAIQNASMDVPELVATDFGFGITVALPPGETSFTYSYRVPANGLTYVLSKTALYPTADLLIFAGEPLNIQGNRLRERDTVTVDGKTYRKWVAPGLVDAGDTILIQAVAEADIEWWPFAAGGAALFAAITGAYFVKRSRPDKPATDRAARADPADRDRLIAEIASLDVAYEDGSIDKDAWERERARLKDLLVEAVRE